LPARLFTLTVLTAENTSSRAAKAAGAGQMSSG
jgi:hypothetical protein